MKLIYAREPIPENKPASGFSIFLAGPTPRAGTQVPSWRPEMIQMLHSFFKNNEVSEILIPEDRSGKWNKDYLDQVDWEEAAIEYCDVLVFWVARDVANGMPGFTTNVEFGWWLDKKERIVLGHPPNADKCRYLEYKFKKQCPDAKIATTMQEVAEQINEMFYSYEYSKKPC